MVIHNLNIFRSFINPAKTEPKLVVDADTVLTRAISSENFQPIPRWVSQIINPLRRINHLQLSPCLSTNRAKTLRRLIPEKLLCFGTTKALDHDDILSNLFSQRSDFKSCPDYGDLKLAIKPAARSWPAIAHNDERM
jgi:hypothetical protein